ncbi:hypothetical protein CHM34_10035 [Paludifilum halophilum]|uniref:N-acetyltransferase domain-containing protein n=1 Tax=Paludifilum halophilum TaxID=1642702 RepID=A0A235B7C1_9BACL|nr:hypothetical protein CHM34_10035 [Paludifilum halophilum]
MTVIDHSADLKQAFDIRKRVFVEEQGVPLSEEIDEWDQSAIHFLAVDREQAVGTARLRLPTKSTGKVERVAVLKSSRGSGLGHSLMVAIEDYARKQNVEELILNAQVQALDFYRKLGYRQQGPIFMDAGIEHMEMRKPL